MRNPIPVDAFTCAPYELWHQRWLLLTVGTLSEHNCMTVGWGSFGCMWNRPFAQIVVRPSRHTWDFCRRFDDWTLCAFPEDYREDLKLLGSLSGRDGDKLARTDLTPEAASVVTAPVYAEAELAIECRSIYQQDMDPQAFRLEAIHDCYPNGDDHHRIFFGEILAVSGTDHYRV